MHNYPLDFQISPRPCREVLLLLAVASRRILFLLIQIQLGTHPVTPADKRRACNQIFEQTSG